jgi:uncharacterized protein YutE (UPF0331/DUF86 family)
VNALRTLQKLTLDELATDEVLQGAVERHLQVAIQATIDIGSLILSQESARIPDTYRGVFAELAKLGILPQAFAARMQDMAGFRNVLVHLYLNLELDRVYSYLQNNLHDFEEFARYVGEYLATRQ